MDILLVMIIIAFCLFESGGLIQCLELL